jgi:Cu(I)/Ag(I) efflux system periplasmic protein CusF
VPKPDTATDDKTEKETAMISLLKKTIAAVAVTAAMTSIALAGSTTATVKAVNTEDGKVTLKHGPIADLGMPAMTMVFSVDPAKAKKLKVGATVRVTIVQKNGRLILQSIN